jgi:hypothetical protein
MTERTGEERQSNLAADRDALSQRLKAQVAVREVLNSLQPRTGGAGEEASDPVVDALNLALSALEVSSECQLARPFASMVLIQSPSGLRICCTHSPEHCRELE